MDTITVQGETLDRIGLGTWALRGETCEKAVQIAFAEGYRHIDTAEFYRNETEIGRVISGSGLNRESIFLTSKVWSNHLRYRDVLQACDQSLKRLGVACIDLYLIHWPNSSVPLEGTLRAMNELIEAGKARYIGVSNFSTQMLGEARQLSQVPIFTNQVEYHVYRNEALLLSYCQDNDILLTAYSPLAKGRVRRDELLKRIGRSHGKTGSQVALKWLVQQDHVIAIPKSSKVGHLKENIELFDFELSTEEMAEISKLAGGRRWR
jgi:diketogulonate reductase-like aldo/keto reductase